MYMLVQAMAIGCNRKVLDTLDVTRADAETMRSDIQMRTHEYEDACAKTRNLMKQLTHKATILEKLKAKVGMATSLSAFLQLNELSDEEVEEDDLLQEGSNV